MEVLNPLSFLLVFILAMVLIGWFLLNRFRSLLLEKTDDRSMLLLQQQVDQLRVQVSQVLDNSTQLIQQQLSQLLGHVNERLRENAEVLHNTQSSYQGAEKRLEQFGQKLVSADAEPFECSAPASPERKIG